MMVRVNFSDGGWLRRLGRISYAFGHLHGSWRVHTKNHNHSMPTSALTRKTKCFSNITTTRLNAGLSHAYHIKLFIVILWLKLQQIGTFTDKRNRLDTSNCPKIKFTFGSQSMLFGLFVIPAALSMLCPITWWISVDKFINHVRALARMYRVYFLCIP